MQLPRTVVSLLAGLIVAGPSVAVAEGAPNGIAHSLADAVSVVRYTA